MAVQITFKTFFPKTEIPLHKVAVPSKVKLNMIEILHGSKDQSVCKGYLFVVGKNDKTVINDRCFYLAFPVIQLAVGFHNNTQSFLDIRNGFSFYDAEDCNFYL